MKPFKHYCRDRYGTLTCSFNVQNGILFGFYGRLNLVFNTRDQRGSADINDMKLGFKNRDSNG